MPASAAPLPIEETTIAALHAAYVSGRSTAVSVCQAHLDRIAAYDRKGPALGAIIVNNPDALSDAAALGCRAGVDWQARRPAAWDSGLGERQLRRCQQPACG